MKNEGAAAEGEKKQGKERLDAAIGGGQKRREEDLEVLLGENLFGDLQGDKREGKQTLFARIKEHNRCIFRWMRNAPGWPSAERGIYTHPWISRQLEHNEVYHDQEAIEPTPADRNKLVEDWLDSFVRSMNAAPASQLILKQRKEHLSLVSPPQLSPQQVLHPHEATRNSPSIPHLTSVLPLQTLPILLWAQHQIILIF